MPELPNGEMPEADHCASVELPMGFPGGASGKEPSCQCRRHESGSMPGLRRSPGEGGISSLDTGSPLQYSGLENSMDCIVHGVAESDTIERLSFSL